MRLSLSAVSALGLMACAVSGSITTNNRGPRSTYTLALQPRRYWFEFVWQSFWTAFMLAIGVFGLWIYRKGRMREQRPKGKRSR